MIEDWSQLAMEVFSTLYNLFINVLLLLGCMAKLKSRGYNLEIMRGEAEHY